jgi:hypothetical protein
MNRPMAGASGEEKRIASLYIDFPTIRAANRQASRS